MQYKVPGTDREIKHKLLRDLSSATLVRMPGVRAYG